MSGGKRQVMIDGFSLAIEEGTGISTYARNLSYALHDAGHQVHVLYGLPIKGVNPLLREVAFFDPQRTGGMKWASTRESMYQALADARDTLTHARAQRVDLSGAVIAAPFRSRLPYFDQLWNARNVFLRADKHFNRTKKFLPVSVPVRPDIAHWTFPLPVRANRTKNIYTIHDLVPLRLPYTTLDIKRRHYRKLRRICREADHIVTVSENSKKDIINLLGVPEERITNTYQAVAIPEKYVTKPIDVVRREVEGTFNLSYKGYLLFYGAIEPKKNVGRLIEAYLGSKIDTPLVVVGKAAWKSEQELRILNDDVVRYLEHIDSLTVNRSRVQRIDYVPFPLLVSLVRGAKAMLFPSLYEGFGLPALEAMTLGTPVLTSTEGSMPEIAGDAAMLIDPYDTAQIADGIRALDSNAELRSELAAKGVSRARLFSTERYRARIEELYDGVFEKKEMREMNHIDQGDPTWLPSTN
ncbi:MAG TPA: glycosyltransferase family 1 protein [Verrucomicrobiae bacterium]|nr:glycosyltransferase family 1 protein [Verrucomicrobiae bacterium]